jgi:outer membrane biogenesis lipoprotein LolB
MGHSLRQTGGGQRTQGDQVMSRAFVPLLMATLALTFLAGCGEKPQTAAERKSDTPAWQGSENRARADSGWSGGDRDKWMSHMQGRAQNQNEYTRTSLPARTATP